MKMNFKHIMSGSDVREFCIGNNLYTMGDNEDYAKMLGNAENENCTPQDVIAIAKDIAEHSDASDSKIDLSVGNIAYYLCDDVMHTMITGR